MLDTVPRASIHYYVFLLQVCLYHQLGYNKKQDVLRNILFLVVLLSNNAMLSLLLQKDALYAAAYAAVRENSQAPMWST